MEARLFTDPPAYATAEWYATRERAPHLEQDGHRGRLLAAAAIVDDGPAVDLGAGDGGLLQLLTERGVECWGYDLQPSNITGAHERGVDVALLDVVAHPDKVRWAPTAIATEMLEHLVDPHGFVAMVAEHADTLIASSPAFETEHVHYAFHLWAWDEDGYAAMLEGAGWRVERVVIVDGFQVVRGRR